MFKPRLRASIESLGISRLAGLRTEPPKILLYGASVALVLISLLLEFVLADHIGALAFLLFYPAVILAAYYGGFGPALLAIALSVPAVLFFTSHDPNLTFTRAPDAVPYVLFVVICIVLSRLVSQLRQSVAENEVLLREVQHRVGNSLQVVSSMLNLQGRRSDTPEVRHELRVASDRVRLLGSIYRRVHVPGQPNIHLGQRLRELSMEVTTAAGDGRFTCDIDADEAIDIDVEQTVAISLIVHELLTNMVFKSAPEAGPVKVRLALRQAASDVVLTISSSQDAMAAALPSGEANRLLSALTRQLKGRLDGAGTAQVTLTFPAAGPTP